MPKNAPVSPARSARRYSLSASLIVALCGALVSASSCQSAPGDEDTIATTVAPSGAVSGAAGALGSSGAGSTLGANGSAAGSSASAGTASSTSAGSNTSGGSAGAADAAKGGSSSGGMSSAGASTMNSAGAASGGAGGSDAPPETPPCEDTEPPPNAEWPEATCVNWAEESTACTEDWFADFCDISCGRCIPEGGIPTPPPPPEKPCEDAEPPPNAEWPDATCVNWAEESDACTEDWFADYCDISCGRCIPEGGLPPVETAPDCSGEGLPNVSGGEGFASRYWDCCQPHCAQFDGHRCSQDGVSSTGDQTSSCSGGGSFACYDEAPHAVSECLSYGHIAKANPNCGQCYRIQFTGQGEHNDNDPGSKLIAGKQMIVKVTNTGSDVGGNQFDLMVPGGGVGQFNACSNQWGVSDLGAQYGGFLTDCTGSHADKKECVRAECNKIPAGSAREGCLWFVDWLQVADNPKFTSQQTDCPF